MKERILIILLIANFALMVAINNKVETLEKAVSKISVKKVLPTELELKTTQIAKEMKTKAKSVLSLRCEDSSVAPKPLPKDDKRSYPKKWHGTASKIGPNLIITAQHLASDHEEKDRKFPITCKVYQRGQEVGSFDSRNNMIKQVGDRDIVFMAVQFNHLGQAIPDLTPELDTEVAIGENLVLITHPKNFLNDSLITFGMVINDEPSSLLTEARQKYWKNSIITNMTAAPGSSGSPVFTLDGRFIGIHVGGERDELQANYQVIFDPDFFLTYSLLKLFKGP
jgi:V8-like Glu-specific endopeptidase